MGTLHVYWCNKWFSIASADVMPVKSNVEFYCVIKIGKY